MRLISGMRRAAGATGAAVLLMLMMLLAQAGAQVTTTTVEGTLYLADGSVASGTLLVSWPAFSTAANQAVAAGSISTTIGPDGFVSLQLAPNAGAYPAGTYYTAVYHLNDGTVSREYWVIPVAASVSISSVRAQLAPATVAIQPVSKEYVDSSIAAITGDYLPLAGGTMTGPLQLSGDPVSPNQAATKHYVDDSAAAELPLTGGSLSGTLNAPNITTKLPRVDVRDPDFGAGCANAADPTGQQDSTCAIEAAIAWAIANPQGSMIPTVYFPAGTYKISSALRIPANLHVIGDGIDSTVIEQTNGSANIFTVYKPTYIPQPDTWLYDGGIERMRLYATGGHLYTANFIELDNATGFRLFKIEASNGGGRGFQSNGATERVDAIDTSWNTIRWPIVSSGNEMRWLNTNIASAGVDAGGYCFGANCVNGVFPNYDWTGGTLVSANGNGTTASFYIRGNGSFTSTSPIVAGHSFTVAGTTGTVLDGTYVANAVTNNVTADPSGSCTSSDQCFEVQTASTISGTATVSSATWLPTILPDNQAGAFYIAGAAPTVIGGSIKANWYEACFETQTVYSGLIEGFYCEGYPLNGQPHEDASILANGLPPWTTTTGAIASNAVPVASTQWFPSYVNDPADASSVSGLEYRIMPQDFANGSTAASADVSGVEQGQYENVIGIFAGDGQFHIQTRNYSGSTAPSNTAWPAGSIIAEVPQSNYGTLQVADSHLNDIDPPNGNWAADCNDSGSNICGEAIVGNIPNGYTTFASKDGGANVSVDFNNDEWWGFCSEQEITGEGCVKISALGSVVMQGGAGSSKGETDEVANGQYLATDNVVSILEPGGNHANSTYANVTSGAYGNSAVPWYESRINSYNDPVLGQNPGTSGGYAFGHQFFDSDCWYDVPPSGQAHALNRYCAKGGPDNTGSGAGWEYDTWNGSAWVNAFAVKGQSNGTANVSVTGSLTAAKINNEVTVDGTTYTTVNVAWNAAVALAVSTGMNQTVRLGPGMYNVTATMSEPTNGACVNLIGSGGSTVNADSAAATTLTVPTNLSGDVFYLGNTTQAQGCTFSDFVVLANANATHGFELQWFRGLLIDNVTVNDTTSDGVLLGEESTTSGHQSNFVMRNVTVSYSTSEFTPADRPAYGVHLQETASDSYMDDIVVRNALTAAVYNEGTGNTGYLVHGFGYPYTCTTAPCVNNASSGMAADASYATSYVIDDVGGGGSAWTDTYADSPAVAGFYIGANGVSIRGGHIQWPDLTSFPAANLAYVAANVTNDMLIADVSCLGMNTSVNWITYAGTAGDPPTFSSVHNLTGCGNYVQDLNPAQVTGFSSGGANINDLSGAVPRVWATPIAAASSYPAYAGQFYSGYQGDLIQGHFSGSNPFFNVTYQGTIKSNGGLALNTVINTASTLTLTTANRFVIANATSGAQTITLPSCYTPWADKASPTGLELTILKSDTSSNAVTLQTVSSQEINYAGASAQTLSITSPGKRTLVCGPDYNWYAY
ncbi:MAG TPA: glycosyl hydrolase family 28-related protein [Acidobacteriaceae bacterium]|nr:glycosyl hydrolase family 28-related protein [Acidobacteriaceae bacterium]